MMDNIPSNLQNILDMLFTKNMLRNFNLYNDKSGLVLKLRFSDSNGGDLPGMQGGQIGYTKKTRSKQIRDSERLQTFSDRRFTRSMTNDEQDNSIEQPRNVSTSSDTITGMLSPVSVIDNHSTPVKSPGPLPSPDHVSVSGLGLQESVVNESIQVENTLDCEDDISEDSDDERVIDYPTELQCSYCGGMMDHNRDIYECDCGRKVCTICKGKENKHHWRHFRRMNYVDNHIAKAYCERFSML
jgi:hypothetical protein